MSFFEFQIISSVAVLILRQIFVWLWPDSLIYFNVKFVDFAAYYTLSSWLFFAGYFVRSTIEQKKNKLFDELNDELNKTRGALENKKYQSKREITSLKEANERLSKRVDSLEKMEKDFEHYKIQNRSAREANLHALKNFI